MSGGRNFGSEPPPMAQTAYEPMHRDDLDDLGKTKMSWDPGTVSNVLDVTEEPPKEMPGFAEGVLGGLTEAFTGILPGFIRDPLVGGAKGVGSLLDIPLEAVGHVPINEWVGLENREGAFKLMPLTQEKRLIQAQMDADPTNADWYMAQYLRTHGGDYATAKGLNVLLAPLIQPDATILERGLMLLGLPAQVIARHAAGWMGRADQIANGELAENAHPELRVLQQRYNQGEFGEVGSKAALDRLLDEMTTTGFGYSNDPFVSMLVEMFTDPIIVGGMGTGLAAKSVRAGALAKRMSGVGRIARAEVKAGKASPQLVREVERVESMMRVAKTGIRDNRLHDDTYRFGSELMKSKEAAADIKRISDQAVSELITRDQARVFVAPLIEGAANVSRVLNEPFHLFGKDGAAGLVRKRFTQNTTQGAIAAFDTGKVARSYRAAGPETQAVLNDSLGYAISVAQRSMMASNLVKTLRTSVKDANGDALPPSSMPDATKTPDQFIDAALQMDNPAEARQMENFVRRVKELFVPEIGTSRLRNEVAPGKKIPQRTLEYDAQMAAFRDSAAQQLSYATGGKMSASEARALLKNASDDELAFAHFLQWGRMVKEFTEAQKRDAAGNQVLVSTRIKNLQGQQLEGKSTVAEEAKFAEANERASIIERATLIGKRELTDVQAKDALERIKAAESEADAIAFVEILIRDKEVLYQNFWTKGGVRITSDKALIDDITVFLESALKEDSLVKTVPREKLSPAIRELIETADSRGVTYEIGIAPAPNKRFAEVHNSRGELTGYHAWTDVRVSAADVSSPTRFDVLRERVWTPIRAENMLQEARRKFIQTGVRRYELSRGEATLLFDGIRDAASKDKTTMRAFSPDELTRIFESSLQSMPRERRLYIEQRVGKRGLAELTARAMHGDLKMVGLTTKITGKAKTITAHHGNYLGVLAEKIYPLIRFNMNPVFLMQEWVEPYFFNILRGVKVGKKWTDEQISFQNVLDEWNQAAILADGFEAREFQMTGGYRAHQSMGADTTVGRLAAKMPVGRVQATKKLNYSILTKREFGEKMHASFQKAFPGKWSEIEHFFNEQDKRLFNGTGQLSKGDIATRWYANKGMYDPDTRTTAMHHWDGAVPDDLGRIDGVRKSHVAAAFGFDDIPALRSAVSDPADPRFMDEWEFRAHLAAAGMTDEYAVRAYSVATGVDVDDLLNTVEQGYPDPQVGKAARDMMDLWLRTMSEVKGITKEEYTARKFANMPKWLGANASLPQSSFYQLADRLIQESGFPKIEATDARYVATRELAMSMLPDSVHPKQPASLKAARAVASGAAKPGQGMATERRVVGGRGAGDQRIDIDPNAGTLEFKERNDAAGMTEADIHAVGMWYEQVGPMFTGVAHGMDDATLRALGELFNDSMPSVRRLDLDATDALADEIGARMLMAWGATQVKTSPRAGFSFVLSVVDAMSRGARSGADFVTPGSKPNALTGIASSIQLVDLQKKQLRAMLVDFEDTIRIEGYSAKLHDFIDSLMGNTQRTYTRTVGSDGSPVTQTFINRAGDEVPMQPGAMDVWMGRDAGLVDSGYLTLMARRVEKLNPGMSADDAMVQAQLQSRFFFKRTNEKQAPYLKRKAAFEKEHGLASGEMQQVWSGKPSEVQYEAMLERYNRIADDLNTEGYLGRGYETGNAWTVADVQAIAWMRIQKSLDVDPGGPANMFHQNATQVAFEVTPGKNTPLRDYIPMHRASDDAKDLITVDVALVLADLVQERTGVQIIRSVPGRGGYTPGGSLSPNTFWEMLGPEAAIDDALDYIAYMTQQPDVLATRPAPLVAGKLPGRSNNKNNSLWSMDFAPAVDDALTLDALNVYLDTTEGVQWNGSAPGSTSRGAVVRSVYTPVRPESPAGWIDVPSGTDLDGFTSMTALPEAVESALNDGSWALEAGLDSPVPVQVNRQIVKTKQRRTDFEGDRVRADERIANGEDPGVVYSEEIGRDLVAGLDGRGRTDVARKMVDGDLEELTTVWDDSFRRNDGNAWAVGRGNRELLSYDPSGAGYHSQRSPRGWRGATAWTRRRDAATRVATGELGGRRGRIYLSSPDADVTTASHELFHLFADDLDPSGVAAIHDAYYTGVRKKDRPKSDNRLSVDAEEWAAGQFEEYSSTGLIGGDLSEEAAQVPQLAAIFNAYDDMRHASGVVSPDLTEAGAKALDTATNVQVGVRQGMRPELKRGPSATFDVDQFRMMEAARIALQAAEEEAFRVHYYKRGRTLLERSINHPYLGLYPASYMWGKVVPELMRFLVKKPFGIDAPFAGMQMANHVYNAIQLELATDNDGLMGNLILDFPEALRFLQLMVPGTPWDIPVNVPAWTRRLSQDAWQGKEADPGGAITDTIGYTFGPGRAPRDLSRVLEDAAGMGRRAMEMASGTYVSEAEKQKQANMRKFMGLPPIPKEPEGPTRLVPGTGFEVAPEPGVR